MLLQRSTAVAAATLAVTGMLSAAVQPEAPATGAAARNVPYADARPVVEALRADLLPEPLRALTPEGRAAAWPGWVAARDRAIRARLARGDDDTIVNFLLYGATFTSAPRPSPEQVAALAQADAALPNSVAARIEDLIDAVAAAPRTERLAFARDVLARNGFDPDAPSGRDRLRAYLADEVRRGPAETLQISQDLGAAISRNDPDAVLIDQTAFRGRGLASDTTILSGFAVERALEDVRDEGLLSSGAVRRAALVGPGLDFTDKDAGYDFYPLQSIQPFALLDTLIRLGLEHPEHLRLTTFDLSPRINRHLENARARAAAGEPYHLALPRNVDLPWADPLAAYWEALGGEIGAPAGDVAAPPAAGNVRTRGVEVRPAAVRAIEVHDLNIVLQRLAPLPADELFDLIVATDILVYYDVFEQSLALANVAAMLRPGGIFVANTTVAALPGVPLTLVGQTRVGFMPVPGRGELHDILAWYRRR